MSEALFSVRMRASHNGQHVSGAERIVGSAAVGEMADELLSRALVHAGVEVDEAHCSVERIDAGQVRYERLPDISTFVVDCSIQGRQLAVRLLKDTGVPVPVVEKAVHLLANGAAPGGRVMRGAVLMDIASGERLEADHTRGVRVTRMDLVEAKRKQIVRQLAEQGLGHHRVCEALVLAGKVMHAPGVVAELCWSDAPDYLAGYVCSAHGGYQRITKLKNLGETTGGRVFFVDRSVAGTSDIVAYLERQPVLFEALGEFLEGHGRV